MSHTIQHFILTALCLLLGDCDLHSQIAEHGTHCVCGVTNLTKFSPDHGGFSVFMPPGPTVTSLTNDTAAGPLLMTMYTAGPSSDVAFSVLRNSFPTNLNFSRTNILFAAGLKQALGVDGRLLSETKIALHQNPGREWKFDKYNGQMVITVRAYLVDHEMYQVVCVMSQARECTNHLREFLDSFELRPK